MTDHFGGTQTAHNGGGAWGGTLAAGTAMAAGVWVAARLTPADPEEGLAEAVVAARTRVQAAGVAEALRPVAEEDRPEAGRISSQAVSSKYARQERG